MPCFAARSAGPSGDSRMAVTRPTIFGQAFNRIRGSREGSRADAVMKELFRFRGPRIDWHKNTKDGDAVARKEHVVLDSQQRRTGACTHSEGLAFSSGTHRACTPEDVAGRLCRTGFSLSPRYSCCQRLPTQAGSAA